jgi:hypothetical protein
MGAVERARADPQLARARKLFRPCQLSGPKQSREHKRLDARSGRRQEARGCGFAVDRNQAARSQIEQQRHFSRRAVCEGARAE